MRQRSTGLARALHTGAWQFVAHVTWRASDGVIDGGVTHLPSARQIGGRLGVTRRSVVRYQSAR